MNQEELIIQENSPNKDLNHAVQGEFLQSDEWRRFQEAVGRKTFNISSEDFWANVIEHQLPIVGRYFYIPRGPICHLERSVAESKDLIKLDSSWSLSRRMTRLGMTELINLARKENAGWIRIEPASDEILEAISKVEPFSVQGSTLIIKKAPHNMQPREILVMDITKSEDELLAEMKPKTRYNIKVAQKHGVSLRIMNLYETTNNKDIEDFLELVKITAERDKITPHPESYYQKMFKTIPPEILKLYVAEYEGKVIAANIVIYYGDTATYLHGASDNEHRNVMAPYILQWQAILDAEKAGLVKYDLGGISTNYLPRRQAGESSTNVRITNKWGGITRFKTGFAPGTKPMEFPGSYDIILKPFQYYLYRTLQKIKSII